MKEHDQEFLDRMHRKFREYRTLIDERGPEMGFEAAVEASVPLQVEQMSPFLEEPSLAEGFRRSIPIFESFGMEMEVVDISNRGQDAVLEIQRYCPYLEICSQYGFDTPCEAVCELDVAAIRRAFPGMHGSILARQAFGDCVCVFKYERKAGG